MVEDTHASNDEETNRRAETEKDAEMKENEEILRRIESVVSCSEALLEEELTAKEVDSESELPERELPESEFLDTFGFNFGDTESSEETETPQPEDTVSNEPKRETRGSKKKKGE